MMMRRKIWSLLIFFYVSMCSGGTIWNPDLRKSLPASIETQHIPVEYPHLLDLRPPRPLMPRDRSPSIFIGIASFRDGERCGNTLLTAFQNAEDPTRVFIGVVDQATTADPKCFEEYCKLATQKGFYEPDQKSKCPYYNHVRILSKKAQESKGPTVARAWQQQLIQNEDFCLQVDAHSIFTERWDTSMIEEWLQADNEMAILSTYITDYATRKDWPKNQHPHLCKAIQGSNGMVRNAGASIAGDINRPLLSSLWGAGLSFGKCHSETRVPLDPRTYWIFDGEEFMKAARLWTAGYDIYTPHSCTIYHDYNPVPHRFEKVEVASPELRTQQVKFGIHRMKKRLGLDYDEKYLRLEKETEDAREYEKYDFGTVRSFGSFLNYTGINLQDRTKDKNKCHQLNWQPYQNFTAINHLLHLEIAKNMIFNPPYPDGLPEVYKLRKTLTLSLPLRLRVARAKFPESIEDRLLSTRNPIEFKVVLIGCTMIGVVLFVTRQSRPTARSSKKN